MKRRLLLFLILALTLSALALPFWLISAFTPPSTNLTQRAGAGCTSVSGIIAVNTTWTTCTLITDAVIVNPGIALTITPGSTVFFNVDTLLRVEGQLIASGYPTSTILFTSNAGSPAPGDWDYIFFAPTSVNDSSCSGTGSILKHAIVEYGGGSGIADDGAIRIRESAPCIEGNLIQYNASDAIHAWSISSPHDVFPFIIDNTITDNGIPGVTQAAGIYLRSSGLSQSLISS